MNKYPVQASLIEQEPVAVAPVVLSAEEYARIADMEVGEGMTDADKSFLAEKGIALESGEVPVTVDDGDTRLMDTSVADFGTRLTKANEALRAETSAESAGEQLVNEVTVQELGGSAIAQVVEVSAEQKNSDHNAAIKREMLRTMVGMDGAIQQGDSNQLVQYVTIFSDRISELRSIDSTSTLATELDNVLGHMRTQLSIDMNAGTLSKQMYVPLFGELARKLQ